MLRFLTVVMVTLAGGLLTACDDDDAVGPVGTPIFGTYTLRTVNAENLPVVIIQVGNEKVEVTAGSIRLTGDNLDAGLDGLLAVASRGELGGTYSVSITLRALAAGTLTTQINTGAGRFTATGSTIEFSDSGDGEGPLTGSTSRNTLTIVGDNGDTFVFIKLGV